MPNEQQVNAPNPDHLDTARQPAKAEGASADGVTTPKPRAPRKTASRKTAAVVADAAPEAAAPASGATASGAAAPVPRPRRPRAAKPAAEGVDGGQAVAAAPVVATPVAERAPDVADAPKPKRQRTRTTRAKAVAARELDAAAGGAAIESGGEAVGAEASPAAPLREAGEARRPGGRRADGERQQGADRPANGERQARGDRRPDEARGANPDAREASESGAVARTADGERPRSDAPDGAPTGAKRRRKPRDRRGKREARPDGAGANAGANPGGNGGNGNGANARNGGNGGNGNSANGRNVANGNNRGNGPAGRNSRNRPAEKFDAAAVATMQDVAEFYDDEEDDDGFAPEDRSYAGSQQVAKEQREFHAGAFDEDEFDEEADEDELAALLSRDRTPNVAKGPIVEDFPRIEREARSSAFRPPAGRSAHEQLEALAPKLHKVLADAGIGSRREMEELILAGRVSVNGEPAHIGQRVEISDQVRVNGKPLQRRNVSKPPRVIIYHKPAGEIVSNDDPEKRATVFERLPQVKFSRWVSVGRLDFNTEGLLIFTTSGELANRLMHPKFGQEREYAVRCLPELTPEARRQLVDGVTLDDGPAKVDSLMDAGGDGANHWYHVTISEGRNREVRRLFETVGATVSRLIRVRYGDIDLPRGLKRGRWIEVTPIESAFLCTRLGIKIGGDGPSGRRGAPHKPREISPLDTMTEAMYGVSPVKGDHDVVLTTHMLGARQPGGHQQRSQQPRRGGIPGMPGMDGPPDGRPSRPRGPKAGGGGRGPNGVKASGGGHAPGSFAPGGKPAGAKFAGKPGMGKKGPKPGGGQGMAKAGGAPAAGGGKPGGKPGGRPGGGQRGGQKGPRGPKL